MAVLIWRTVLNQQKGKIFPKLHPFWKCVGYRQISFICTYDLFLHGINCPTDWFSRCQFLFIFKYVVGSLIAIDGGVSRKLWWYYFYRQVGIATLGDWFKVEFIFFLLSTRRTWVLLYFSLTLVSAFPVDSFIWLWT